MLFFSFSSRQEYYVLPGLPGVALIIGGWLARETVSPPESVERRNGRIASLVLMGIGVAACVACFYFAWQAQAPPAHYDIAELLKKNPQDYALSFGHFLYLTPQAMGAFKAPLLMTGTFYAANANLQISGQGNSNIGSQYISRTLNISGQGNINVTYSDKLAAPITIIRLVQ